jgi:transcriptional regulator with XRE-family HTH domain
MLDGNKIREARKRLKLTQRQLAMKVFRIDRGLSLAHSYISLLENNSSRRPGRRIEPHYRTVAAIARALGVRMEDLEEQPREQGK